MKYPGRVYDHTLSRLAIVRIYRKTSRDVGEKNGGTEQDVASRRRRGDRKSSDGSVVRQKYPFKKGRWEVLSIRCVASDGVRTIRVLGVKRERGNINKNR